MLVLLSLSHSLYDEGRVDGFPQDYKPLYVSVHFNLYQFYDWLFLICSWYRYRKLLCMVDLTKDFFYSYSYHVMRSLQKNMCDNETGPDLYDSMFVWNEYMTRGTRNLLHNTIWTVALVYGFFKQVIHLDLKLIYIDSHSCGIYNRESRKGLLIQPVECKENHMIPQVFFLSFLLAWGLILRIRSNLFDQLISLPAVELSC